MNAFLRKIVQKVRDHTPLWLHWKLGPAVAFLTYWFRIYILGNKDAPKIFSAHDTLDLIIRDNLSVIRFGDGEMSIMQKADLGFQKSTDDLAGRLKEILRSNQAGLLICIPGLFGKLDQFTGDAYRFALHHQFRYRHEWLALLSPSQTYGDTLITRPYLGRKQRVREGSGELFRKLFSIWKDKDVVLIEGSKSRVGVGNDMFKQAVSVQRILGPAEHAFDKLPEILSVATKLPKDKLVVLALGPAAKVLGYELFRKGYRVIDVGHVDMEYEMYVRKLHIETKIPFKYLNEINERNPEDCTDPEYLNQIIATIE